MATIDILVPVLGRPQNVKPLLETVKVTDCEYRVYFICSPGDREQIKACRRSKMETLVCDWEPGRGDFAKKINWAFPQTDSPWVFQAADDLCFHWGWDIFALRIAGQRGAGVIGTNDLGNPLVKRGGHSTHTLIRRSYIDEYGGTYDDTGLVFCELYDHQYCDNEFVQTAIRRGQWAFAKRSIVEHLHPHWGKAPPDATYEKATRATREDGQLYLRRNKQGDRQARRAEQVLRRDERIARRRRAV